MRDIPTTSDARRGRQPKPSATPVRRIDLRALFGEAREIVISHRDQDYRLRVTSNGKLILTK